MKNWMLLVVLLMVPFAKAEKEVRCYRVSWPMLERAWRSVPDPEERQKQAKGDKPDQFADYWKPINEAGFQSRFLKEKGTLRDCGRLMGRFLFAEFAGDAVYHLEAKHLVVRASPGEHLILAEAIGREVPMQAMVRVSILEKAGVSAEPGPVFWPVLPAGVREVAAVSSLGVPGFPFVAHGAGGELGFDAEVQFDQSFDLVELRLEVRAAIEGRKLTWKSGLALPFGIRWVEELGSLDGETSLFLGVEIDLISASGIPHDEWILKENGGAFLGDYRLNAIRRSEQIEISMGGGMILKTFPLPIEYFPYWFSRSEVVDTNGEEDPFAPPMDHDDRLTPKKAHQLYQGQDPDLEPWKKTELYDVRNVIEDYGIIVRDEDFVVWSERQGLLIAKLPAKQMALLDGMMIGGLGEPRLIRIEFCEWEGEAKDGRPGERLVRKLSLTTVPGQPATLKISPGLSFEAEAQIDQNDQIIEVRAKMSGGGGKTIFDLGVTLNDGRPMVVHESRVRGKRRAWVMTGRIVRLGRELDESLKAIGK